MATSLIASVAARRLDAKRRDPTKKARRWVVEVCHSWFNRFRKLLVRYEKLEQSFVALNHIAAAVIAFRKVPMAVKIILMAAGGLGNGEIAARLDTRRKVISEWRKRFFRDRMAGLDERPRPGRPLGFSLMWGERSSDWSHFVIGALKPARDRLSRHSWNQTGNTISGIPMARKSTMAATALAERYAADLHDVLLCYDRIIVTGTLPGACYAGRMTSFLYSRGIRIFDYPKFAEPLRDRIRERTQEACAANGVSIEHVSKSHIRKEELVARVLATRGEAPGLVHVRFFGMLLPSDIENPVILQFGSGCTLRDVVEELRWRLGSAFPCELIGENGELFNTCRVFVDGELLQNMSTTIFPRGSAGATLEIILLPD